MKLSGRLAKHKRRFDRGGLYLNYIAILVSGGTFLKVFGWTKWYHFVIGTVCVVVYRYFSGFLDEKTGILSNEQGQYSRKNPEWTKMTENIEKILTNTEKK